MNLRMKSQEEEMLKLKNKLEQTHLNAKETGIITLVGIEFVLSL